MNSEMETWRAEALRSGTMVENTRVTLKTERKTVRAPSNGLMAINISAPGNKESSMVSVSGLV